MEKIEINERYISEKIFDFEKHPNIVLQSQTGTGKTSNFFKSLKESGFKFISLVAKRSLGKQHYNDYLKYCGDKTISTDEINSSISYYTDNNFNEKNNLVFCINSIMKIKAKLNHDKNDDVVKDFMTNRILFIDEMSIFLSTEICKNSTLDGMFKEIFVFFLKLVKYAKGIYLCQSNVDLKLVEILLSNRENKNIYYIENTYQVMKNKKAIKYENESMFTKSILADVGSGKGFLVGCDSKDVAKTIYNLICKEIEDKTKIYLITSETSYREYVPKEGDIVVYSPSITYGCDFTFDNAQNQYIYIKNNHSIDASQIYQQAMRTRNLDILKYYIAKEQINERQYKDYEDCKEKIMRTTANHYSFLNMCAYIDDSGDMKVVENMFFKFYIHCELKCDIMNENLLKHFEKLLMENGFEINLNCKVDLNSKMKYSKIELKDAKDETKHSFFEVFQSVKKQEYEEDNLSDEHKLYFNRCKYLNIYNDDDLEKYSDYIFNDFKRKEYYNFMSFIRTFDETKCLKKEIRKSFDFKILYENTNFKKILMLRKIMQKFKINIYNLNENLSEKIEITTEIKELMDCTNVKKNNKKYEKRYDLIKWVCNKMRDLFGDEILKKSEKKSVNNEVFYYNYIDFDTMNKRISLYLKDKKNKESEFRKEIIKPLKYATENNLTDLKSYDFNKYDSKENVEQLEKMINDLFDLY